MQIGSLTSASRVVIAVLVTALPGCGTEPALSTAREGPTPFPEQGTEEQPGGPASPVPTAEESRQDVFVNEAGGWSIVVPDGWEVVEADPTQNGALLTRDQAIAEILVAPGRGLTIEELQADQVDFLSGWPGAHDVVSRIVRLPAGEAVRGSLVTTDPDDGRYIFISYLIEKSDRGYGISVRGPQNAGDLEATAKAIAESFVISTATPVASQPQRACTVSDTSPIGANRIPAWGQRPLYAIGPMVGTTPGPRSFTVVFFRVPDSDEDFVLRGEDAMTGAPLRFAYMRAGERRGELGPMLQLTDANGQDASDMGRGWISWMVAVEFNTSGCYTLRAGDGLFGDQIEITIRIG